MKKISLNFTGMKYLGELHEEIKEAFGFPHYYGENLDALWDCLAGYSKEKNLVEIIGSSTVSPDIQEYMTQILKLFDEIHQKTPQISFVVLS